MSITEWYLSTAKLFIFFDRFFKTVAIFYTSSFEKL